MGLPNPLRVIFGLCLRNDRPNSATSTIHGRLLNDRNAQAELPPVQTLPPEILIHVFEYCCPDATSPSPPRYEPLKQIALVCTSWSTVVQWLIFRRVVLFNGTSATKFLATSPDRGAAVSSLHAVFSRHSQPPIPLSFLAKLLESCPQVQDLRLHIHTDEAFDDDQLQRLAKCHISDQMRLNGGQDVYGKAVRQLLSVWSNLRYLQLRGHCLSTLPPEHDIPLTLRLYQLELDILPCKGQCGHFGFLDLIQSSSSTLEILTLGALPAPNIFNSIADLLSPNLRSLGLPGWADSHCASLRRFTKLEEFRYEGMPPATLLNSLPPMFGHLSFFQRNHELNELIAYISGRARGLHTVTCNGCATTSAAPILELANLCRKRKITLRCLQGWYGLYYGETTLGSVSHFPRLQIVPKRHLSPESVIDET